MLLGPRPGDQSGTQGYRFWFPVRDHQPVLSFEQRPSLVWNRQRSGPGPAHRAVPATSPGRGADRQRL